MKETHVTGILEGKLPVIKGTQMIIKIGNTVIETKEDFYIETKKDDVSDNTKSGIITASSIKTQI